MSVVLQRILTNYTDGRGIVDQTFTGTGSARDAADGFQRNHPKFSRIPMTRQGQVFTLRHPLYRQTIWFVDREQA